MVIWILERVTMMGYMRGVTLNVSFTRMEALMKTKLIY